MCFIFAAHAKNKHSSSIVRWCHNFVHADSVLFCHSSCYGTQDGSTNGAVSIRPLKISNGIQYCASSIFLCQLSVQPKIMIYMLNIYFLHVLTGSWFRAQ